MAGGNAFLGAVHAGPPPAAGGHPGMARAAGARAGRAPQAQATNWLQPLNSQQVVQQATSMVKAAYQPATQALNQQSTQASNILAKQQADNKYYQQWLDSKTAALQTQQNQVEQTTNQLEQQLTGNQLSQYGTQASTLINAANAREGNVSNDSQSSAFNANLAQNQAAMQTVEGGAAQHMLAGENNAQAELGAATANSGAFLQAGAQRETAAFNTAMTKIAGLRSTLSSNEGASIEKEIARLQGVQINLSQSNRNYSTAATKLGLSAANINSQINTRAANTKISQQRLATQQQNNAFNQWFKGQQLNLSQKKFAQSVINSDAANALKAAETYKAQHGGGLTPSEQDSWYNLIAKGTGELNGLIQRGMSPQNAYQAMLNGGFVQKGKFHSIPRMSNQSFLNASYNLRQGGPGLNQGDVNYLTQFGLAGVGARLRLAPHGAAPAPAGNFHGA